MMTVHGFAQMPWSSFVEHYIFSNEENSNEAELIFEQLNELHRNPMDLNAATFEQLLQIPVIDEQEVSDIVEYRKKNYPIRSFGELQFIPSLSRDERDIIPLFAYIKEESYDIDSVQRIIPHRIWRDSRNEIYLRSDVPLYTKAGGKKDAKNPYQGSKIHQQMRYSFETQNHIVAGIQTEKDDGEKKFDYLAAYFMLHNVKTGSQSRIKEFVAGNYRATFGLGLVFNTNTSFGKNMKTNGIGSIDYGFTRHASFVESNYLSGAALRYQYGKVVMAVFGAYNRIDAVLNNDSTGITSIKTDGMHRTALEYGEKNNVGEMNIGANIHLNLNRLNVSATAVTTHFSKPLAPIHNTPATLYRSFDAAGSDFYGYGIAYSYRFSKVQFTGETAMSHAGNGQNGMATLAAFSYRPNVSNTIQLFFRNYGARYVSIHGNSFSENSRPQNERGLYLAWFSDLTPTLNIYTFFDMMYFPWLKYKVSDSSYGWDYTAQASFTPKNEHRFLLRYHIKSKQNDHKEGLGTVLKYNTRQTLKLQYIYTPSPKIRLTTTLDGISITFGNNSPERGFSISEKVHWEPYPEWLKFDFSLVYVDTDTYNARIYSYEPSLLYSFGIQSYYYQALRGIIMATVLPWKKLRLTAKYFVTKYLDRENIGTGNQQIDSSSKSDLQLQLRWIF